MIEYAIDKRSPLYIYTQEPLVVYSCLLPFHRFPSPSCLDLITVLTAFPAVFRDRGIPMRALSRIRPHLGVYCGDSLSALHMGIFIAHPEHHPPGGGGGEAWCMDVIEQLHSCSESPNL